MRGRKNCFWIGGGKDDSRKLIEYSEYQRKETIALHFIQDIYLMMTFQTITKSLHYYCYYYFVLLQSHNGADCEFKCLIYHLHITFVTEYWLPPPFKYLMLILFLEIVYSHALVFSLIHNVMTIVIVIKRKNFNLYMTFLYSIYYLICNYGLSFHYPSVFPLRYCYKFEPKYRYVFVSNCL